MSSPDLSKRWHCADFGTLYLKPNLKTPSVMERQAANFYVRAAFEVFQEEFIQSLGDNADKIEDGTVIQFVVFREEDNGRSYTVTFNQSDKQAKCTCCMFEYAGVLCRHVLRIFMVGFRYLPEEYTLKRWIMDSVGRIGVNRPLLEPGVSSPECLAAWYNHLCQTGLTYAMRSAMFPDVYKVAIVALQKAFAEVVSAKDQQMSELKNRSSNRICFISESQNASAQASGEESTIKEVVQQ